MARLIANTYTDARVHYQVPTVGSPRAGNTTREPKPKHYSITGFPILRYEYLNAFECASYSNKEVIHTLPFIKNYNAMLKHAPKRVGSDCEAIKYVIALSRDLVHPLLYYSHTLTNGMHKEYLEAVRSGFSVEYHDFEYYSTQVRDLYHLGKRLDLPKEEILRNAAGKDQREDFNRIFSMWLTTTDLGYCKWVRVISLILGGEV